VVGGDHGRWTQGQLALRRCIDAAKFAALVDAPVTALGLPRGKADPLEQALGVRTVRDLADNRYVRRAQAIVHLANAKQQS
jgi:hypothetical protein